MRILILFCILLIILCFVTFSQNTDLDLLKYINMKRNVSTDFFFTVITNSAAPLSYALPVIMLVTAYFKKDLVLNKKALNLSISVISAMFVTYTLKLLINRKRPFETYSFIQKIAQGGSPSFPSGHTTDAFALATSLSLLYPRCYVIILSYLWAALVGYSRIHLGVHYPSDVLAGMLVGSIIPCLCSKILWRHHIKTNP